MDRATFIICAAVVLLLAGACFILSARMVESLDPHQARLLDAAESASAGAY